MKDLRNLYRGAARFLGKSPEPPAAAPVTYLWEGERHVLAPLEGRLHRPLPSLGGPRGPGGLGGQLPVLQGPVQDQALARRVSRDLQLQEGRHLG